MKLSKFEQTVLEIGKRVFKDRFNEKTPEIDIDYDTVVYYVSDSVSIDDYELFLSYGYSIENICLSKIQSKDNDFDDLIFAVFVKQIKICSKCKPMTICPKCHPKIN